MLAIRPQAPGGPEVLTLAEVETPAPGPGEVLIRIEAAGVNFIDIYQRSGQYKVPTPIALGLEGAGVVEALGEGAAGVAVGERVAWASGPGSYATHVVIPAAQSGKVKTVLQAVALAGLSLPLRQLSGSLDTVGDVLFYLFQIALAAAVVMTMWSGYEFFRDVRRQHRVAARA